jgi:hypothetical protein
MFDIVCTYQKFWNDSLGFTTFDMQIFNFLWEWLIYRLIRKPLWKFWTQLHNNQHRHCKKEHINRYRISPKFFLCTRHHGVLASFTARRQSWQNMAWTGNKKAFCVLEFAKTESSVMVQQRFRTKYHTEPSADKPIHEWYMKFQQSGCPCTVKQTGRSRPSAKTAERV